MRAVASRDITARDVSGPAQVMGDPIRARILVALAENGRLPATDLAECAAVPPALFDEHLGVLVDTGLLVCGCGERPWYTLADEDVARAVDALAALAPGAACGDAPGSRHDGAPSVAHGRRCSDHLGGALGLRVTDLVVATGALAALDMVRPARRPTTLPDHPVTDAFGLRDLRTDDAWAIGCLDWTERRPHLAGPVGRHVFDVLSTRGWIESVSIGRPSGRNSVVATPAGERALAHLEAGRGEQST